MNQRPLRTLFVWTIWAAVTIFVYVAIYSDTGAAGFVQHDRSRISWVILGMFLFGVIMSFGLVLMVTLEYVATLHLEEGAKENGLSGVDIKSKRRAVYRLFRSIKQVVETNGEVDVENLLHLELAVYRRISHTIDVMGNLLITLGLIGTVAGLSLILTGLTGSLEALGSDQETLLAGLRKAMGGMGTAFYNTLLGVVLGGVLLRVYAQITDHGIEGLNDTLMRLILVYCSGDLRPSAEREIRHMDAELTDLTRRMSLLGVALRESRDAMMALRQEALGLNQDMHQDSDMLTEEIRRHLYYRGLLREEARLIRKARWPWWNRPRHQEPPAAE